VTGPSAVAVLLVQMKQNQIERLFAEGTIPAAFKVTESTVTSKGVIIVNYERAGAIPTGNRSIRPGVRFSDVESRSGEMML
jgi:hypothetical protein